jgi:hypothetical protein
LEEAKHANEAEIPFDYKYATQTVCLVKPSDSVDEFWLTLIIALGNSDHRGEYEVWWLTPFNKNKPYTTTYHPLKVNRVAMVGWEYEESLTDDVGMVAHGKKISVRSQKTIKEWVRRWEQADAGPDADEIALNDPGAGHHMSEEDMDTID